MYVLYLGQVRCQRICVLPMNHLEFKMKFCESLVANYRWEKESAMPNFGVGDLVLHVPKYTRLKHRCIVCLEIRCHYFCNRCGMKFICLNKGCFEKYHVSRLNQAAHGHL